MSPKSRPIIHSTDRNRRTLYSGSLYVKPRPPPTARASAGTRRPRESAHTNEFEGGQRLAPEPRSVCSATTGPGLPRPPTQRSSGNAAPLHAVGHGGRRQVGGHRGQGVGAWCGVGSEPRSASEPRRSQHALPLGQLRSRCRHERQPWWAGRQAAAVQEPLDGNRVRDGKQGRDHGREPVSQRPGGG